MEPPSIPDYYGNLGVFQTATSTEIKRAHRMLAKKYHPDKQAPGTCADAQDFRRVQEAYEFLQDAKKRAKYDIYYESLQAKWEKYRGWQKEQAELEQQLRAEEEAKRKKAERSERARKEAEQHEEARKRAECERKAAEEQEAQRRAEEERIAKEREEKRRWRELREKMAEERSREAARRAREQQEQAAKERLRQAKEEEAERRSQEAARRDRIEREKAAQERLRMMKIEERQASIRENWARMKEALEHPRPYENPKWSDEPAPRSTKCDHPRFGWPRKKGKAICSFCEERRAKFSFRCPDCDAAACPTCRSKYCIM